LYEEGLRTKSGRKIYRNQIKRTLDSSFSAGLMPAGGKYYEGNHTPLISKTLFDKVQNVMHNRSRPRPQKHFFPLRGFLSCEACGCALTASLKKGHQYYYCTNGKKKCEEHKSYLREKALYDTIAGILGNLSISDRKIELMYQSAKERVGADNTYAEQALATLQTHLESLKTRESKLLDTFLAEQISKELYDEKVLDIFNDKVATKKQIKDLELKQPKITLEPTKKIFKQASTSQKEFLDGDDTKKRKVVESLLWNLSLKDKKVASIKYKTPFDILAKAPKDADFPLLCAQ
jgi:site-specific DNA recombinase